MGEQIAIGAHLWLLRAQKVTENTTQNQGKQRRSHFHSSPCLILIKCHNTKQHEGILLKNYSTTKLDEKETKM